MIRARILLTRLFLAGSLLAASALFGQDEPKSVRLPDGNGRPILTDGIFSPGEWDDALKIDVRPTVQLLLKKGAGFVFIGVRYLPSTLAVVDLFISPDGKAIRQLHVSAQLGERLLNETPGLDDDPEVIWGDTTGWYANEVRWNEKKVQALMKEGKSRDEAQEASIYKYDGFEFQIRQSKFGADAWLIRLESAIAPDWTKPVVYPEGTGASSTEGWLKLVFD